jgi:hypothetical protein
VPSKLLQHLLQHLLRRDVQVVAWLVQQQEVGVFQRQQGQRQPPALAAAEQLHRLVDILGAEEVLRQIVARRAQQHLLVAEQFLEHGVVGVHALRAPGRNSRP